MCARHGLDAVLRALASGKSRSLLTALRRLIDYLSRNALRSHPKRDRRSGRLQFNLEPVLQNAQVPTYEPELAKCRSPRRIPYTTNLRNAGANAAGSPVGRNGSPMSMR